MKFLILLLVFVVGFTLVNESFGQREEAPQEDPSLKQVSLQLQLRNSDGQLITYIEPKTMYILNLYRVHEFLDTKEDRKIVEIDGEKYEEIKYQQRFRFADSKQIATYGMWYKESFALLFRHDGFLTAPGDTLDISWKIIRVV